MFSASKVSGYLQRIGLAGEILPPTHATLCKIMRGQLCNIPYGNLDVVSSTPNSVQPAAIFEKLVVQGREGHCIEHNLLLREVLLALKFELISTVTRGLDLQALQGPEPKRTLEKFTHPANIVIIDDEEYLVDVGYGFGT